MERSIIFILLSMLLSCTGNKAYDQQLSKADSIMDIADDSAQIAIKMLDALKPEWSKFTKAQRGYAGISSSRVTIRYGIRFKISSGKTLIPSPLSTIAMIA